MEVEFVYDAIAMNFLSWGCSENQVAFRYKVHEMHLVNEHFSFNLHSNSIFSNFSHLSLWLPNLKPELLTCLAMEIEEELQVCRTVEIRCRIVLNGLHPLGKWEDTLCELLFGFLFE